MYSEKFAQGWTKETRLAFHRYLTMPFLYTNRCDNTIGSFACVRYMTCGTGYTLNRNSGEVIRLFQLINGHKITVAKHFLMNQKANCVSQSSAKTRTSARSAITTATRLVRATFASTCKEPSGGRKNEDQFDEK